MFIHIHVHVHTGAPYTCTHTCASTLLFTVHVVHCVYCNSLKHVHTYVLHVVHIHVHVHVHVCTHGCFTAARPAAHRLTCDRRLSWLAPSNSRVSSATSSATCRRRPASSASDSRSRRHVTGTAARRGRQSPPVDRRTHVDVHVLAGGHSTQLHTCTFTCRCTCTFVTHMDFSQINIKNVTRGSCEVDVTAARRTHLIRREVDVLVER